MGSCEIRATVVFFIFCSIFLSLLLYSLQPSLTFYNFFILLKVNILLVMDSNGNRDSWYHCRNVTSFPTEVLKGSSWGGGRGLLSADGNALSIVSCF